MSAFSSTGGTKMVMRAALICLGSLAVLSCTAQYMTNRNACYSDAEFYKRLQALVQESAECEHDLQRYLNTSQLVALLHLTMTLSTRGQQHQEKPLQGAEPKMCPDPEVHRDGGIVCITISGKRYCKPMCNQGYDFEFTRRGRPFEECSHDTNHKWSTQYIGGKRLAFCRILPGPLQESSSHLAGNQTAYFPANQNCLEAKQNGELSDSIIRGFVFELRNQGVNGEYEHPSLVCG